MVEGGAEALFPLTHLTRSERELRLSVRAFLSSELPDDHLPGLGIMAEASPSFSRRLGERGWLGMALPSRYGGHDRSTVDRFVVAEELLAAGAPIMAHWFADRQSAPTILSFGTEEQKQRFLPAIAHGTSYFSIGMSEPDAGSDLASVRTRARKVAGGWVVNGTKVWITGAHYAQHSILLCRTDPEGSDRHGGLSQLIVELSSPGVRIQPIPFIDGSADFNEVVLEDVFVPDEMVLGNTGDGWKQVMAELTFERSGPDRFLSNHPVLESYVRECRGSAQASAEASRVVGRLVARLMAIRAMGLSVARSIDQGRVPAVEAAMVKIVGTLYEQEVASELQALAKVEPDLTSPSPFTALLARAVMDSPAYTIRGGTVEVLRSVVAGGLGGCVIGGPVTGDDLLDDAVEHLLTERCDVATVQEAEAVGWSGDLWTHLAEAGLPWVSLPEGAGGSGGTLADAFALLVHLGRHAAPVPFAETGLLGGWALAEAGMELPVAPVTVPSGAGRDRCEVQERGGRWIISGRWERVPWARASRLLVVLGSHAGRDVVIAVPTAQAEIVDGQNLAGEPRETVVASSIELRPGAILPAPLSVTADELRLRAALARAALMRGAMERICVLTRQYAAGRVQFGRPIDRFQSVQAHLVTLVSETMLAKMAVGLAIDAVGANGTTRGAAFEIAAARSVLGRSAETVCAAAHQIHGAMGMTREYELQLHTRRLWSWRQEFGDELEWSEHVGREVLAEGAGPLYPRVVGAPP